MRRLTVSLCALLLLSGSVFSIAEEVTQPVKKDAITAKKTVVKTESPAVEVVFVLDTTGSMGGLINAAKEKVWAIANTLATAKPIPTIKMGLVGYRDRGDQYVTKVTQLSEDLDTVYKDLMGFQAAGGGDGPESVNQALHEAVTKIQWSTNSKTYRVIFLVGDAPPHMDYLNEVQYPAICELAAKADIVINAIQCGNMGSTTPVWVKIAQLSEGKYFRVEQSGGAILASTPFDKELAQLSSKLGSTRLYYGDATRRFAESRKSELADEAAESAPTSSQARRADFFAKEAGKRAFGGEADLIQAIADKRLDFDKLDEKQLPEKLKKMNKEQRKKYVEKLAADRKQLQVKIAELGKKRQAHIRKQLEKNKGKNKNSLDQAIYESIQKQAASKGLKYEGGPEY
jgi:Mg-chelatase subunit ChlD